MRLELVFHVRHRVSLGKGLFLRGDVRPDLSVLGVDFEPLAVRVIGVRHDRVDGAFGLAHTAIDALVRLDDEEILPLVEAVHWADFDAIGVFACDARVRDDIGQGLVSPSRMGDMIELLRCGKPPMGRRGFVGKTD